MRGPNSRSHPTTACRLLCTGWERAWGDTLVLYKGTSLLKHPRVARGPLSSWVKPCLIKNKSQEWFSPWL